MFSVRAWFESRPWSHPRTVLGTLSGRLTAEAASEPDPSSATAAPVRPRISSSFPRTVMRSTRNRR